MADLSGRGDRWPEPDEMTCMPTVYTTAVARRVEEIEKKAQRLLALASRLRNLPKEGNGRG